jgi:hypothetical protein
MRIPPAIATLVRAYNGPSSRWYQAAMRQGAGRIIAGGITKDVVFESVEGPVNETIDAAYQQKYEGSPYLSAMIGARASSATVKIVPRESTSAEEYP